ncbi:MAG TPA: protein kinase, partial [Polyangiaceae bacterium]|nr:protein kinase [Polyangiaceae bacterium]
QLVGIGAMGRVYRGFQRGIDRDVAVKILHRELSANPTVVARFHREAKVASRLAHPNVVHVLLTGQLPDGAMYIVMEYLDGMSLQSALAASGGAMPLPRALHVALQLCDAVGEAHAQGIVHRDLKPENVMLVKRADDPDFVKVLDFGIARLNWGDQSMATAAGLIFGTARYISPEAAQGEKVAPPGDVYSIAMMFYQLLCGRTAFEADQAVALLVQQIHDPPPHLKGIARAAYVPDAIADAVMRNLAKKPEGRAANGREFGRALLEAAVASGLSAHDILARPGMSGTRPPHVGSAQGPAMDRTQQMPTQPRPTDRAGGLAQTVYDAASAGAGQRVVVRTEIGEVPAAAMSTAKWSPAGAPQGAPQQPAHPPTGWSVGHEPARITPSNVDATMDEQQQPVAPASAGHTPSPSQYTGNTPPGPSSHVESPSRPRVASAPSHPSSLADGGFGRGDVTSAPGSMRGIPGVDVGRTRVLSIVVACFLVGAIAMAVASKAGLLGGRPPAAPSLDAVVARANDSLIHQRWDAPHGDNVRDITDDGLARWPHDAQLLRIRALACGDVVKAARARRDEGNLSDALRLAKLAYQLDPSDESAQKLAADLEVQAQVPPNDSVPPLATAHAPSASTAASSSARAILDASTGKPGVGQPVDFSARVTGAAGGRTKVEAASFRFTGPGIASGTQLDAADDGSGVFRTTFTFLQPGRFEVAFGGRADGSPVRAVRTIQVGQIAAPLPPPQAAQGAANAEPKPPAPPPASAEPPSPPAPSAKWL